MKKIIMMAAMMVATLTAGAQSNACQDEETFSLKPYAGFSLGDLSNTSLSSKPRSGFTVGAEGQYMFNEWFGVSGGLAYSQQGVKITEGMYNGETLQSDYLNIPVLANFYIVKGLSLKLGIQPGFLVNSKLHVDAGVAAEDYKVKEYIRSFDIATPVGISYETGNVVFDARYNTGIFDVFKDSDIFDAEQNLVFQLTLGYRINFQ